MKHSFDYVVVGSGCSGAMATQTLVEAGVDVTMIDAGMLAPKEGAFPANTSFLKAREEDKDQYKYLIGDHGQGINWGEISKGAQVTPPRQYIAERSDILTPMTSKTFSPLESLGYGGLGIGWGLQCWEYSKAELQKVGLDTEQTKKAYDIVSQRIGISATRDNAASYTINNLATFQPSATADRNHRLIERLYAKKAKQFKRRGIFIGRTPLALLTKPKPGRKAYRYLGTDFYSDADKSAWRPWMTIDELKQKTNFHYYGQLLVTSFKERGDVITIKALDTTSGEPKTFTCRHLILATGALGSARIVMRSLGHIGSKVPLLSNPHTYIPCIQPRLFGKGYEEKKLGLGQLSYFIDTKGSDSGISVASSYSYQSLMLFRIITQLPFNFADGRILSRFLTPGLVIMIAQHPDSLSPNKYLKLVRDPKSLTGDKIEAHYVLSAEDEKEWDKREHQYVSVMRKLHTYPLKRVKTEHGSAIHYAGTLPFSNTPQPMRLTPEGRLHGTKHVHVADSSGFQFLPAKGLTFTLMANAHMVAENSIKGESMRRDTPVVAITGASGFLGSTLTDHFINKKWKVIALVRNAEDKNSTSQVEYREYDITKPISKNALKGVDYLVHAAYVKLDAKNPHAFQNNVDGAKQLLAAAKKARVKQSLFISTMSAHEEAISVYGKQKLAIEQLFLSSPNTTVLRCGLILGDGGIVREMAGFMKSKHAVPLIGGGNQPLQVISVNDLCRVISNAFERTLTGRFVAAHPQVYSYHEFYKALAHQLNVRVAYIPIPYGVLQFVFRTAALLHIPLGVGEDNLKGLKKLKAMPSSADMKKLGVQAADLPQALQRAQL